MALRSTRIWFEVALFVLALVLTLVGTFGPSDESVANVFLFVAWCAALFLLFLLGLRLPRYRGRFAPLVTSGSVVAAVGLAFLANVALYRHDASFDLTIEGRYTAPPELWTAAGSLDREVAVTYFYNSQDSDALATTDVLAAVARRDPHLRVRALDLDKELIAARDYGVRLYNTLIVESHGRRVEVDNTTDLREAAFAIERVLKQRTPTVCFVTGHGEPYGAPGSHVHLGHTETMAGPIATVEAPPAGIERLQLAIEAIGYSDRAMSIPTASDVPADCAVVADIAPRSAYSPDEVGILRDYLAHGGHLLLMYDPEFPATVETQGLLGEAGLEVEDGIVVDPTNHAGTEQDNVAVAYYQPHPITDQLALTVFPAPRPIRLLSQRPRIQAVALASTSQDSYVRAGARTASGATSMQPAGTAQGNSGARGPATLAVALQGNWPRGGDEPFRLVLVGSASFAANAFFPYASNSDLAVAAVRWLAGDTGTPKLKPATYAAPEITLTHREMQVTFILIEILLPLSVILFGVVVWQGRR